MLAAGNFDHQRKSSSLSVPKMVILPANLIAAMSKRKSLKSDRSDIRD